MGISYNPRIVTDGLVLALDGANLKSYSQNVFPYPLDGYSWGTSGYQMTVSRDTSTSSPVGNSPLKLVTSGTSAYTNTYNSSPFTLSPAAQGQTWTFSFWVKGSSSFSASMLIFESNSSGNYTAYGQPYYSVTTEWTRVSGSYTMIQATTTGVQVRIDCYVNGVTLWVDGFQLEKASSASSFNSISNTNGTTWRDLIGNGNNGTLTNGPTYSSANGGSIVFDGTNDYVSVGVANNPTQQITLESWINPNRIPSTGTIRGGAISGDPNHYLGIFDSIDGGATHSLHFALQTSSSRPGSQIGNIPRNVWSHIVGTYDGARMKAYLNGVMVYDVALTGTISGSGNWAIGCYQPAPTDGTHNFDGKISNAKIYNRALTAAEIQQNYNAHKGRFKPEYETLTYTASGNLTVTGNGTNTVNIFKTSGGNAWDNQAYSLVPFNAPCTIEFNKQAGSSDNGVSYAMIGWNIDPLTNASYDTLDYASYPYITDSYQIYNNGSSITPGISWSTANKFYIVYGTDGFIRHYNGSTLLYSVNYGAGNTVYVDSSFYSPNATFGGFSNIKVIRSAWNGTNYV